MRHLLFTLLLACGCVQAAPDPVTIVPEAASGFAAVNTVTTRHYMAATANPLASDAAATILRRGGSAADAAIAAQLVLGLVEPQSSGLGGGAFLLYWDNSAHRLRNYDGRETAPAAVDERHFLAANGKPLGFFDAVIGGHAVGTPGVVKMLALVHRQHGKLPWPDLFEPAIALAEQGFPISPRLYALLRGTPRVAANSAIRQYFFQADGSPKPVGHRLKNPAYAATLKLLAREGEAAFYRGPIAHAIVEAVQKNESRPGKLALADLSAYQALERDAVCGSYQSYRVCGPAPPSSGGIAVLAILGMLERFDAAARKPETATFYHLFAETSRLAFADRDTYVADPAFAPVPVAGLIAPAYLAARAALISPQRRLPSAEPGRPAWPQAAERRDYLMASSPELVSTSHVSIVDAAGNAVSMTTSIETAFGSRLLAGGFLLNNQLTDFSFVPVDSDGERIANRIEAGKRPRSSMAPIIVFRGDKPVLLLGSPGGARIIDYVAKTLVYLLDGDMPLATAIASPHIIELNRGLELEQGRVDKAIQERLRALGHSISEMPQTSGLNGIWIGEGTLVGSSDPRREGTVTGD